MKITFNKIGWDKDALVLPVFEGNKLVAGLPPALNDFITKALDGETAFTGKNAQTLTLRGSDFAKRIILLGAGKQDELDEKNVRKLASPLSRALAAEGLKKATLHADILGGDDNALAAHLADELVRNNYEFKKYKTSKGSSATEVEIQTTAPQQAEKNFDLLSKITESSFWASDLANEPGNILNPKTYAEKIKAELAPLGIKVTILDKKDMQKLGMGAALAVGQGSATPPCMVVMEYNNCPEQKQPLGLVGKGITFDSGGISLKPGAGMGDMTLDMGGSAAVVGAMRALAGRGAKTNVVAVVGLAENMPSGEAYRPGDIVTSMSGKTIYVGNTDAEGRLVLADALTYIQRTFSPHTVVDLATLTGAAVVALGQEFAAFYANDNSLSAQFNAASANSGEKIWRMPLMETDRFTQSVRNTPLADLTNTAQGPGSCTAAAFLHEFIEKDDKGQDKCKWVHIDMAGPGIPTTIKKGWGVLLLNQLLQDHYEANDNKADNTAAAPKTSAPKKKWFWG